MDYLGIGVTLINSDLNKFVREIRAKQASFFVCVYGKFRGSFILAQEYETNTIHVTFLKNQCR
jgi:hypothetical protein